MSVRQVRNSLNHRAHDLHDILLPMHRADRLGSKAGAIDAIVAAFEAIISETIESFDGVDLAVYRLRKAIEDGDEIEDGDIETLIDGYEEASSEIVELEAKLKGEDLDEKAPAVAAVLGAMERDQQLLRRLEKLLSEDGSAAAQLALTRLEEWRKDEEHKEEDL